MPTFGRRPIYTDETQVTVGNVLAVLNDALYIQAVNQSEIVHLFDVYRGRQEILNRKKDVRPEINNKCVRNHANEIVSFKVSYLLSEPIIYVNRGANDASAPINQLNEYMHIIGKAGEDKEIADDFNICGVAYRMVLPNPNWPEDDSAPFVVYTLNPAGTFLIRNSGLGHSVVAGVTSIIRKGGSPLHCVYTPTEYFEIDTGNIIKHEQHTIGQVPIFEYVNNKARLGSFETVETLLDAMNTLESNRLDATEQTVQALTVFKNCDIDSDGLEAMRQLGAIKLTSTAAVDADIELITASLQQEDQQVLMDSLYKTVLTITGMPAQSSENKSDSSNNGAVFMRAGWYSADARAKDSELLWRQSEMEFLRLVLRICRDMEGVNLNLNLSDIGIKFTRRNYEDILSKSQTLRTLLEAGIHPRFAISQCGLFGDPTEVYEASIPWLEKWIYTSEPEDDTGERIDGDTNHAA